MWNSTLLQHYGMFAEQWAPHTYNFNNIASTFPVIHVWFKERWKNPPHVQNAIHFPCTLQTAWLNTTHTGYTWRVNLFQKVNDYACTNRWCQLTSKNKCTLHKTLAETKRRQPHFNGATLCLHDGNAFLPSAMLSRKSIGWYLGDWLLR